jgi:hypothetical protein
VQPDFATYAQIIATLFVALAVEVHSSRVAGPRRRGSFFRAFVLELDITLARVGTPLLLVTTAIVLTLDCVAIGGKPVQGRASVALAFSNSVVISCMAVFVLALILDRARPQRHRLGDEADQD